MCSNDALGDPRPNHYKQCYCTSNKTTSTKGKGKGKVPTKKGSNGKGREMGKGPHANPQATAPKKAPKKTKSAKKSKSLKAAKQPKSKSKKSRKGNGKVGVKGGLSQANSDDSQQQRATNSSVHFSLAITALIVAVAAVPLYKSGRKLQEWWHHTIEQQYMPVNMPLREETRERQPQRTSRFGVADLGLWSYLGSGSTVLNTAGANDKVGEFVEHYSSDDESDEYGIPADQQPTPIASSADFDSFDDFGATNTIDLLAELALPTIPLNGGDQSRTYGTTTTTSF